MKECVICAVFPDHKGTHYNIARIYARIRQARIRLKNASKWCELPGCFTAQNDPIMATAYMTEHPHAHSVAPGYWICEKNEEFEAFILDASEQEETDAVIHSSSEQEETDAVTHSSSEELEDRHKTANVKAAADLPAPEYDATAGTQEDVKMANSGSQGYLTWSKSGLQVDVCTNGSDGGRPDVAHLKKALRDFEPPDEVVVTITEILGRGDAWVSLKVEPRNQAQLLISTGLVIGHLTNAGICDEILLAGGPRQDPAES